MTIEAIMIDGTLHTRPALFAGHPGNFVVALFAYDLAGPLKRRRCAGPFVLRRPVVKARFVLTFAPYHPRVKSPTETATKYLVEEYTALFDAERRVTALAIWNVSEKMSERRSYPSREDPLL